MTRKQFIESQGATCLNWNWSWSFVNHAQKFVIFGAWDRFTNGNKALIVSADWATNSKGKKKPAYPQAREHIRLIQEEGYNLKTFPMKHGSADPADAEAPSKIKGFIGKLSDKSLIRIGEAWYASDGVLNPRLPEELDPEETLIEGARKTISVNQYERNPEARKRCLAHYGHKCVVCAFDFKEVYGAIGEGYLHVHHVLPLADIRKEYAIDPERDLVPICPNCHAMIHATRPALAIKQLCQHLRSR